MVERTSKFASRPNSEVRTTKDQLHPRSRFRSRYDFARLAAAHPALAALVKTNAHGDAGIDYADPRAVKALNAALLRDAYGLRTWVCCGAPLSADSGAQ